MKPKLNDEGKMLFVWIKAKIFHKYKINEMLWRNQKVLFMHQTKFYFISLIKTFIFFL